MTSKSTKDASGPVIGGESTRHEQIDESPAGESWDGKIYPYIPRGDLTFDSSLTLHTEWDKDVDPIDYQVLRSRFWHINLEHCDTIKNVSGSPVIVWSDDFNTCLLTEDGDTVVSGPSIQYFTGVADLVVRWTLENRSSNPGISDGDVFLENDPFIGAPHQQDTSTYSPVFWEGKLFCWIFSQCHVGDIGGIDPGSFCVAATDIFTDPLPIPPIKLARGGEIQVDVADMFARQSRTPDMIALQLRSQIAGIHATRRRILEALERYGPGVVKGTMRRMISECSVAVGRRLSEIPDGEWAEAVYTASVGPTDRQVHRETITVRKSGDRLICSNAGTDTQLLSGNSTYSAWRSALISAASALFASDQMYCPAGVASHLEFEPVPGTRNVATFPAAISALTSTLVSVNLAYLVMSKVALSGSQERQRSANAAGGLSLPGWWMASGLDRHGKFVVDATGDSLFGAIGAFAHRDGVDTGGAWWFPRTVSGNAEEWEDALPILYLYRGEKPDSGGPGEFRGGNGAEIAIIGHKTDQLNVQICSTDPAVNSTRGLAGGYPGHSGNHRVVRNSRLLEAFACKQLPRNADDVAAMIGPLERVGPKTLLEMGPSDVLVVGYCAGGGVGDPLLRDADTVAKDVANGLVSARSAERHWGVVCSGAALADPVLSRELREKMRTERIASGRRTTDEAPLSRLADDAPRQSVSPGLDLVTINSNQLWGCSNCGTCLGEGTENFKSMAVVAEASPSEVDDHRYPSPSDFCDADVVFRSFFCPGCGQLLSVEICQRKDEPLWDFSLSSAGTGPEGYRTAARNASKR